LIGHKAEGPVPKKPNCHGSLTNLQGGWEKNPEQIPRPKKPVRRRQTVKTCEIRTPAGSENLHQRGGRVFVVHGHTNRYEPAARKER